MFGTGLVEIERGKFAAAQPFYWQTDTAIAKNFVVLHRHARLQIGQ